MFRTVYAICLIILCSSCTQNNVSPATYSDPSSYVKPGEELVYCVSDNNLPNKILFYKSDQVVNNIYLPAAVKTDFKSYYITDVLGKVYSINSNEMPNYTCEYINK